MHGLENIPAHCSHDIAAAGVGVGLGKGAAVGTGLGAGMGIVGVGIGVGVGAGVGTGTGTGMGIGVGAGRGPVPDTTVMSAQFQNCSPQPKCPFGPDGPEQDPDPAVHQAALDPTQ